MVPALMTAAQPIGGRSRPPRQAGDRERRAERAERLAGEEAQQDTDRHWGSGGAPEQLAVDGDPGVGQRKERHDGVARPWVEESEQLLVRWDGGAQAMARRALELRRRLLAEPAETLGGPVQLRPADGTGAEQQAERQAEHDRLYARFVQRDPCRDPEWHTRDAAAHA